MAPDSLPLFPLETVLFPGTVLPLHIFEPRYRKMFAARVDEHPIFGIILTKSGREVGDRPETHAVGTSATLLQAVRYDDGRVDLIVRGDRRFRVLDGNWDEDYLTATIEWLAENQGNRAEAEAARLADEVRDAFAAYLESLGRTTGQHFEPPEIGGSPAAVAYAVCAMMPFGTAASQRLLETDPTTPLLHELLAMLRRERELLLATGIGGSAINHPGRGFSAN